MLLQSLEQQLAYTLRRQLGPSQDHDIESTDQSMSIFNEKKTSRFLSLKDDDEDDDENLLRESILLS